MLRTLTRNHFTNHHKRLLASAAAAQKANPLIEPVQQKTSRLPNKLTVSSVDLQGATSQLVFAFRSGSRFEQYDEAGLTHQLRNAIGTDSANFLGVKLLWVTGQTGSSLSAKLSKDLFLVCMTVSRTVSPVAISVLGEFIQPALKPWDVLNVQQTMEIDLKKQSTFDVLVENLHRAAFRNGSLANPLLSGTYNIGVHDYKRTAQFVKSRWLSGETALVGVNVDHTLLLDYAIEHVPIPDGSAQSAIPSPYLGGDVRQNAGGPLAHVAIVGQGARLTDEKACAVQAVLCAAIGSTELYTNNANISQPGVVASSLFKASNHNPFQLQPLNITYADNGLVGIYMSAEGAKIHPYVKAAAAGLRELASKPLGAEALEVAKRTVELQSLNRSNCSASVALDHTAQVLAKGTAMTPVDFVELVKGISADDVKQAANQLCAKLTISAYGQLHQVPYLDEL